MVFAQNYLMRMLLMGKVFGNHKKEPNEINSCNPKMIMSYSAKIEMS